MKIKDLIEQLSAHDGEDEIVLLYGDAVFEMFELLPSSISETEVEDAQLKPGTAIANIAERPYNAVINAIKSSNGKEEFLDKLGQLENFGDEEYETIAAFIESRESDLAFDARTELTDFVNKMFAEGRFESRII